MGDQEGESMVDLSIKLSTKVSRKDGEKLRRDKLNNLITQLAEEVPTVKYAHRRLDKSAILRLTVSYMKLQQCLKMKSQGSKKRTLNTALLSQIWKIHDSAILVVSASGTVLFVTPKITDMLGHYQTDMIGFPISQFLHPEDISVFMSQFNANHVQPSYHTMSSSDNMPGNNNLKSLVDVIEGNNSVIHVRLCRAIRKKLDADAHKIYEVFRVNTCIEDADSSIPGLPAGREAWMVASLRPLSQGMAQEMCIQMSEFHNNNEWASLHALDGKIISLDKRASLFHGYMTSEHVGKSPYLLVVEEDLEYIAHSHKLIMKDQSISSTIFRMKNLFNKDLYISSRSIIIKDKWTKKPTSIVSVNTVLGDNEGKLLLNEQKRRIDEMIRNTEKMAISDSEEEKDRMSVESSGNSDDENTDSNIMSVRSGASSIDSSPRSVKNIVLGMNHALQIHKETGKQLVEIYEEHSKFYPDLYEYSSSSNDSFGVKRSLDSDSVELDSNPDETISSVDPSKKQTNFSSTHCHKKKAKTKIQTKRSKHSQGCVIKSPEESVTQDIQDKPSHEKPSSTSLPILKSILQGQYPQGPPSTVFSTKVKLDPVSPHRSQTDLCSDIIPQSTRSNLARGIDHCHGASEENVSGSQDDFSQTSPCSMGGAAMSVSDSEGLQSPTVGSSDCDLQLMPIPDKIHSMFSKQLMMKHAQLQNSYSTQCSTLKTLSEQIQRTKTVLFMDPKQEEYHQNLIRQVEEAENQMQIQKHLLEELQDEIQSQQEILQL